MLYTQIEPGQKDWLAKLNDMLKGYDFNYKHFQCTMKNGASGWGSEVLLYNGDIFIAQVNAWVTVPGSGLFIDFMDNPLYSLFSFDNFVTTSNAVMSGGNPNNGYGRLAVPVMIDNNGSDFALWSTESNMHIDKSANYSGGFNLAFTGTRSALNI